MKYEFTGYRPGDEKEIGRLFNQAFGGRSIDLNKWKFVQENGNADHYCIANMWDGEKLIAHAELLTAKAFYKGELYISGTAATVMADGNYLGAGAMAYKWIDKKYPDYIKIGFPNDNAFPLVVKILKHNYLGEIDFWWKRLTDFEAGSSNSISENDEAEGCEIRRCRHISDDFEFTDDCKGYEYALIRDKEFLEWRFLNRNKTDYPYFECRAKGKLTGYMFCSLYRDEDGSLHGQIVDIMAKDKKSFQNLIVHAGKFFADKKVTIVKLWMTDKDRSSILKGLGFNYGLRPFHMECWHQEIDMEKSYFTMADSDIF